MCVPPISDYIPELRNKAVKVWHLMCHSGGYFPLPRIKAIDVAREMGIWEPGSEDLAYSQALAQRGVELVAERLNAQCRLDPASRAD